MTLGQLQRLLKAPATVHELVAVDEFGHLREAQAVRFCESRDGLPKDVSLPLFIHQRRQESLPVLASRCMRGQPSLITFESPTVEVFDVAVGQ